MLFTTLPQLIVLAVLFLGGVFIGLGLHPGGKKWKQRFTDESANYTRFRGDAEDRLREANERIATLERDNAALTERAVPAAAVAAPVAASAATPASVADDGAPRSKGWFGTSGTPDLARIRGIDAQTSDELIRLGVTRFEDIAELTAEDETALEQRLSLPAGSITREQWREQAALLAAGQDKDQAERFGER